MCDEGELTRLAIYMTIDDYMRKYELQEQNGKKFKLTNGYKYKVKFNYDQYVYFNYWTLLKGSNVGLNKDNVDGYVIVYPINSRAFYRHDFLWVLIKTDDIIDMICNETFITNEIRFSYSRYKFNIQCIISKGKLL